MARMDPEIAAHLEWLGFVQPTGLVVSAPALVRAGAILNRRDAEGQQRLGACVQEFTFDATEGPVPWLPDFRAFAAQVLGWSFSPKGYAGVDGSPMPPELEAPLPEYGETLRPDLAVCERDPQNGASPWQLLVRLLEPNQEFNQSQRGPGGLEASAHGRMERLLRHTGVPAGLLFNGRTLRLISAPRGESSGWLDFRVADMLPTAGRPICTALRLLLSESRLLSLPRHQRLAALLEDSRKFQNEVSERLAEQVLHALYELLRGFQAAHDASGGMLLSDVLVEHPDAVYRALLTVMLRLVFLLYAEERDMLPENETFLRYYSIAGLYERLREDAALYPDTMDQRYGAWAQLLVLFRMLHDGAVCGDMCLPKRPGVLFDPDRFPFLEGRPWGSTRQSHERMVPPLVPDGTLYRALDKLLVLDGERISYRALDVEQIGSVYETMMGFRLETATGLSASIKASKKHGAPTTIDLEALLIELPAQRKKWLQDRTDRQLTDRVHQAVREAKCIEALHAALEPVLDKNATPDLVPKGAMVLQPSEERRRSGSHYTPRTLTEPIVCKTLEPILTRLRGEEGQPPRPDQILDLKICDPAMGSGAFLVETCRQLGKALIEAWHAHDQVPAIPLDENEEVYARRLIAQRCLYGVDRNPVAVDLAKVSLWLVTLAKASPLTFLDHALRHGDSLVGLSRKQIEAFHWEPDAPCFQAGFETMRVREHVVKVAELRHAIREADESVSDQELRDLWQKIECELGRVRLFGDLIVASFCEGEKAKEREMNRCIYANAIVNGDAEQYQEQLEEWRHTDPPLAPFHWEIEFPEVFAHTGSGFDAIVGNPPWISFSGREAVQGWPPYLAWLDRAFVTFRGWKAVHPCFVERVTCATRSNGTFGLILPAALADLDSYGNSRAFVRRHGKAFEPLIYFGEDAFVDVIQPSFALVVQRTPDDPSHSYESTEPFAIENRSTQRHFPDNRPGSASNSELIKAWEQFELLDCTPKSMFKDPGVHTGNCSKALVLADPSHRLCTPVREGKSIMAYRLATPSKWLALDYEPREGEYFRIGLQSTYLAIPIVLRQTANRPVAALHDPPNYFRNSVLACLGLPGIDNRVIVCWLNSSLIGWFHIRNVREASQRTFPQIKVKHLRSLPVPQWNKLDLKAITHLHDQRARAFPDEVHTLDLAIDLEIGRGMGLSDDRVRAIRDDLARMEAEERR